MKRIETWLNTLAGASQLNCYTPRSEKNAASETGPQMSYSSFSKHLKRTAIRIAPNRTRTAAIQRNQTS